MSSAMHTSSSIGIASSAAAKSPPVERSTSRLPRITSYQLASPAVQDHVTSLVGDFAASIHPL